MFSRLPRRSLLPALCLLAGPALADPAEDCRNRDLGDAPRLEPCTTAIEAATDPADRADLLLWRAAIHDRAGRGEEAVADFEASKALRPDWADPYVDHGWHLKDGGDLEGAIVQVRKGLEVEPGSLYAHSNLLAFLADAGRWQECLDAAPRALEAGPDDATVIANRGRCYADGGQHEAAIADARRAIELGLEESYVHNNLAWSLIQLGRPAEAVPEAVTAVALDPEDTLAHRNLVRALALSEDVEGAVEAYRAAAPTEATDRRMIANDLAWDLYVKGHAAEALPFAEEAVAAMRETGEKDAATLDTLGHLLAAAGRAEEAVAAFLEAVEAEPARAANYAERLETQGIAADPAKLDAGLLACAETGAACRLSD